MDTTSKSRPNWKFTLSRNLNNINTSFFYVTLLILTDAVILMNIPILRQLICFPFFTILPGLVVLQILKQRKMDPIEKLVFSVGLSLSFLMIIGLLINTLYPYFGISDPISIWILLITINIALIILFLLCNTFNKDFIDISSMNLSYIISPRALFLCLIPFLAIFSTYIMNYYNNSILMLVLICIIGLLTLLIGFNLLIEEKLYSLAIFVIALSLTYHISLISMYVNGYDAQLEYYLCNQIKTLGIWNPALGSVYNSTLSLVILIPIFSILLNIEITWVFKLVYPLIFSLVPLILYLAFKKQTNSKIAFLSAFFFISLVYSFSELTTLARQEIAELYLALLILLMIDKHLDKVVRTFLSIIFAFSLIASHYGVSYIYLGLLISAWLLLILNDNSHILQLRKKYFPHFMPVLNEEDITINSHWVLLYIVFAFLWYMYISSGSPFYAMLGIGKQISAHIYSDFLNPQTTQGLGMMTSQPETGILHKIYAIISYSNQVFIIIGISTLLTQKMAKFNKSYLAFSISCLGLLFACVSVPFLASSFNMGRIYQIVLSFLAPFSVLGGIAVLRAMFRAVKTNWGRIYLKNPLKFLFIYFVIFMLYETGSIYYIGEGHTTSISLNNSASVYSYNEQEVLGTMWLKEVKDNSRIGADEPRWLLLCSRFDNKGLYILLNNLNQMQEKSYVYLGTQNTLEHSLAIRYLGAYSGYNLVPSGNIISRRGKIYVNGKCEIYK